MPKITKTGKAPYLNPYPYPKQFTVRIECGEDGHGTITRTNENFSVYELYGVLQLMAKELERQLAIVPTDETKKADAQ